METPNRPSVRIALRRLANAEGLPLPAYATAQAAGLDLCAAIEEPVSLAPGQRALIKTGLAIALPDGLEAQIRPRSGLALRHGLTVLNSPGTIDADYRGEIAVALINLGQEEVRIARGDRIAQMVIAPVIRAVLDEVDVLPDSIRGSGGFGSTGIGQGKV
jgi:dUTP pyrophosphatase